MHNRNLTELNHTVLPSSLIHNQFSYFNEIVFTNYQKISLFSPSSAQLIPTTESGVPSSIFFPFLHDFKKIHKKKNTSALLNTATDFLHTGDTVTYILLRLLVTSDTVFYIQATFCYIQAILILNRIRIFAIADLSLIIF